MAFTQKYTIISPIERVVEGQTFESINWPLHTTIADTFAVNSIDDDLILQIHSVVVGRNINIKAMELSHFGKNADVEVMLLKTSPELYKLHSDVTDLLLSRGATFNDPQYTKSGFIGHVTQQVTRRMGENEQVSLNSVALIDMFPGEDPNKRRVVKVINF